MRLKSCFLTTVMASVVATTSLANDVKVKLGGSLDMMVGAVEQKLPYHNSTFIGINTPSTSNKKAIVSDGRININIDGELDSGLKYGGLIYLNADPSIATSSKAGLVDKSMVYVQSDKIGRLEAGNYPGAGGLLGMDTFTFAKAAYGVEGYWSTWVKDVAYVDIGTEFAQPISGQKMIPSTLAHRYLMNPNLPSNYSGYHYSDAPKITFYTQPITGLTVGVSYIPDLDSTGTIRTQGGKESGPTDPERLKVNTRPTFKNIISGGVHYHAKLNPIEMKMSLIGEIGKAKKYYGTNLINDLKAYQLGLALIHGEYSLAGSYGNWGKTATYLAKYEGTKQGTEYWNLIFAQQKEKLGYSLSYMQTRRAGGLEAVGSQLSSGIAARVNAGYGLNYYSTTPSANRSYSDSSYNTLHAVSLGVDYKLAPGFIPYIEATRFIFKSKGIPNSNSGFNVLTGLRLKF